jgi:hypothetical protein
MIVLKYHPPKTRGHRRDGRLKLRRTGGWEERMDRMERINALEEAKTRTGPLLVLVVEVVVEAVVMIVIVVVISGSGGTIVFVWITVV